MLRILRTIRTALKVVPRRFSSIDAEMLEDRILMSAVPIIDPGLVGDDLLGISLDPFSPSSSQTSVSIESPSISATTTPVEPRSESSVPTNPSVNSSTEVSKRLELVFLNENTPNYQSLLDDLLSSSDSNRQLEVYLLDAHRDGIEQISAILDGFVDVDAIHFISHAKDGAVQLGDVWLNSDSLIGYAGQLVQWQSSLTENADLMFYGCDLAASERGLTLLESLATLSGADVAASTDITGAASLGGDWDLEFATGLIETQLAVSDEARAGWFQILTLQASDDFQNNGAANGSNSGTGWAGAWNADNSRIQITNGNLADPTGQLTTSGKKLSFTLSSLQSTSATRNLSSAIGADGTTTWISFLVQPASTAIGAYAGIQFGNTSNDQTFVGYLGNAFIISKENGSSLQTVSGISASSGQSYFIAIRIDALAGNDSITVYVNPLPGSSSPSTSYSVTKTNLDLGVSPLIEITGGSSFSSNNAMLDEIRIGTTYLDVAPIVNAAPSITSNGGGSNASISVSENSTTITTVTATDANISVQTLTYSLLGGADAAKFTINSATGVLSFLVAPNFEIPGDAGSNNVYDVVVQVSDSAGATDTQSIAVTVTNVNDPPIGGADSYTVAEDGNLTTQANWFNNAWSTRRQISFNNAIGSTLTDQVVLVQLNASNIDYSLTQNSGQDLRFVDTDGTVLQYEIEQWNESGTSTVWVRVPQINGSSTTDSIWMYYGNAAASAGQNASGVWTSSAQAILHMNGTLVDSSAQANVVTNNGSSSTSGMFSNSRNFDGIDDEVNVGSAAAVDDIFDGGGTISAWIRPTGWGENGYGRIADKASSTFGGSTGTGWALQVNGNNGSLIFEHGFTTTQGEWKTAAGTISLNVWQNVTVVYDSSSIANSPRIFIDGIEVAVTRAIAPAGSLVSDSANDLTIGNYSMDTTRTFAGQIDEFRLYNSSLSASKIKADYDTAVGLLTTMGAVQGPGGVLTNDSDIESDALTAILVAGPANASAFSLNTNGSFSYTPTADYSGSDSFTYRANDGTSSSSIVTVSLTVMPVNDAPVITSHSGASSVSRSISENTTSVTTVTASDVDGTSPPLTYSLSGGSDQSRFTINAKSGALSFLTSPNFESPSDINNDNIYNVVVTVSDGQGGTDTQAFSITITDVNEFSVGSISDTNNALNAVNENAANGTVVGITARATDADGTNNTVTYSLTNNAGGRFAINATTGVVSVANGSLLNREAAASHTISVRATSSDGSQSNRDFTINLLDVNEFSVGVTFDQNSAADSVDENAANGTVVGITAKAIDADATTNSVTYSLTDSAGGRFAINATSGVVTVANGGLLDREASAQHFITVRATSQDGSFSTNAFRIGVAPINEFLPVFTTSGVVSIAENQTFIQQLTATDADLPSATLNFSVVGGPDMSLFESSPLGQLTFRESPDFENPTDSNHDNVYEVVVRVSDGQGGTSDQLIQITVTNINEAPAVQNPVFSVLNTDVYSSVANGVLVGASDPEGDLLSVTLVSSTSHGSLSFQPDGSFVYTPDSIYIGIDSFTFSVDDGAGGTTEGTVTFLVQASFIPPTTVIPDPTPTVPSSDSSSSSSDQTSNSTTTSDTTTDSSTQAISDRSSTQSMQALTNVTQANLTDNAAVTSSREENVLNSSISDNNREIAVQRENRPAQIASTRESSIEYRIIRELAKQADLKAIQQQAATFTQNFETVIHNSLLWNDLDRIREQVATSADQAPITFGTVTGFASSLSVGYVVWLLRGGYIVAGVMAQLPAWGLIDPLPILSQLDDLDDGDDDSLASMVDKSNSQNEDTPVGNEFNRSELANHSSSVT